MDTSDSIIITLLILVIIIGVFGIYIYISDLQRQKNTIEQQLHTLRTRESISHDVDTQPMREIKVMPINVPTQKIDSYKQVGILSDSTSQKVLPLYGRRTVNGSSKWNYYTSTDSYHSFDISVSFKNKDCADEFGCEELTSGDIINIPAYNSSFTVNMYKLTGPTYIPYVV